MPKEFSRQLPLATAAHNWLTLAQQGLSGALLVSVSLPWSKNLTRGHTEPNSFFCSKNEFTPPPKGGGAGYRLSWVCRVCLTRLEPAHTAPTGPVWSLAGVVLLLSFQNRTQGHVGLSLVSTLFLPYSFALAGLICPAPHARKNAVPFALRKSTKLLRYSKSKGYPLVYVYRKAVSSMKLNNRFYNGKS